ncbi:MAG: hypothetical protein RLZ72_1030 [Actinomycetota bacterium]|jgi:redox-sensitive bicupin YhaK (pirin superfamily)
MSTKIVQPREVVLTTRTNIAVRRTVPHRDLKRIGAWIFVDHFGPTNQTDGMVVAAHPHTGLQTVTWLFDGEVEHRDSIGSVQMIEPGQVNLMTAGRGISHSELSIKRDGVLHAVQLWLALPNSDRHIAPQFEHCANLPTFAIGDAVVTVFAGTLSGMTAPVTMYTDSFGAEVVVPAGGSVPIPVGSTDEVAVLVVEGHVSVNNTDADCTELAFVEPGSNSLTITSRTGARVILLGGSPFTEKLVMWWNFVERSHSEIRDVREAWNNGDERFGSFTDRVGGRIPAPDLPSVTLQPRA